MIALRLDDPAFRVAECATTIITKSISVQMPSPPRVMSIRMPVSTLPT